MATTFAITSGDIEGLLEKSILRKAIFTFERDRVYSMIKSTASPNLYVDGLDFLLGKSGVKGLKKKLVDKYKSKLPGVTDIPESIMADQGALMDSLMFGYNTETGGIELYTLNERIIGYLGVDNDKLLYKTYELNKSSILNAYRIDIEYNSPDDVVYKAVSLNKNTNLQEGKFILFPYDVIKTIIDTIANLLVNDAVLRMEQNVGGMKKERFLTNRTAVLEKYCDDPTPVASLKTSLYPLKGYLYAPVVGAPSTTAMMSKVNVFNLDVINVVTSEKQITVKKAEDPLDYLIKVRVITRRLSEMQLGDPVGYSEVIARMPRVDEFFEDEASRTMPSQAAVGKYLNSITNEELTQIVGLLPGVPESCEKIKAVFMLHEEVNIDGITDDEFKNMLKNGVYNIIATKKDCSYTSMIVTNSSTILRMLYGKDYVAKYESFGYRYYLLTSLLKSENGSDVEGCLKYCGFDEKDPEILKGIEEIKKGNEGDVKKVWLEKEGKKDRASAKTDSILARSCFASIDEDGKISDFYRYVTLKRVARIVKLV